MDLAWTPEEGKTTRRRGIMSENADEKTKVVVYESSVPAWKKTKWANFCLRGRTGRIPFISWREEKLIESEWSEKFKLECERRFKKAGEGIGRTRSNRIWRQRNKKQSPIKIISDGNEEVKEVVTPADWFIKSRPRRNDSWVEFAARYGKSDEQETKWSSYLGYCKSSKYKKWKEKVLRKYKYLCQGKNRKCGNQAVFAHHLIYRKWGQELVTDGLAVCWGCHEEIHKDNH
jgi:hypothetical protein